LKFTKEAAVNVGSAIPDCPWAMLDAAIFFHLRNLYLVGSTLLEYGVGLSNMV